MSAHGFPFEPETVSVWSLSLHDFPVGFILSDNFYFRRCHSFESNTQAVCNYDRTITDKMLECTRGRERL